MRSVTSKPKANPRSPSKFARVCSEAELPGLAREIVEKLRELAPKRGSFPGALIQLEGEMGAGKSTFARRLLEAWGVVQPPEGSPTFAIAHEYAAPLSGSPGESCSVVHIDFYRLKDPSEIEDAGLAAIFWERPGAVILTEWLSMFPGFEEEVRQRPRIPQARIRIEHGDSEHARIVNVDLRPA